MPLPARPSPSPPRAIPVAPSLEEWRAMSPQARERFIVSVNEALSDEAEAMSEGQPHKRVKSRAMDMLGLHFKTMGRVIYLAEDLSVVYPGEAGFSPDILAVLDVPQPEDDERLAWVVADEGKGPDFVLEVLHHGNKKKDLVYNVERYARLGIPEYFIYNRGDQSVIGYRLPRPEAKRYERVIPQLGRHRSAVLGLDLAVQDGSLRFFQGMAELFDSADLINRLNGMMQSLESKAQQAVAQAEQSEAKAEQSEAKAQQTAAQAQRAMAGMREALLAVLRSRGIACPDDALEKIKECEDPEVLQRWVTRALSATSAAEVFSKT